jgi:thioredoxin-like negative regulator of GroEL
MPGQKDVMLGLARTMAVAGRMPEAERMYTALFAKFKTMEAAYAELYRLLLAERKSNETLDLLKAAARNLAAPEWFLVMIAAQGLGSENRSEMVGALQQMKARSPKSDGVILMSGDFYLLARDVDTAAQEYRACQTAGGQNKSLCQQRLIDILLAQRKTADADALNDAILKDNSRDPQAGPASFEKH